jgi:hypothetical protein
MSRKFPVPLLTAVFLAAPATFGPVMPAAFSGSAQAAVNYNSSKSNSGNVTKTVTGITTSGGSKGYGKTYNTSHSNNINTSKGAKTGKGIGKVNNTTTRSNTQHN